MQTSKKLSDEELVIYSRQIALDEIGFEGQVRLRHAKVCVVGLGGLGAPTALKLTGMGVGALRLVDRDVVSRTDLHRQYLYDVDSIGSPKVDAAADRLSRLNPGVKIEPFAIPLTENNAKEIVNKADVVIDALDNIRARYMLNRACVSERIPFIFGAGIRMMASVSTIVPYEGPCLECFYSDLDEASLEKCAVVGVHPSVLGIASSIQVSEAVRLITGKQPRLLGRLLLVDLEELSLEQIEVKRRDDCPVCGERPKGSPRPIPSPLIEESCGRDGVGVYVLTPKVWVELDMGILGDLLRRMGLTIEKESRSGVTFQYDERTKMSLLKSGVGIAYFRPPIMKDDPKRFLEEYKKIVLDGLKVEPI